MQDQVNAFVDIFTVEPTNDGQLSGKSFAVKDLYDVAGHVTGYGNPTWAETHPPADQHSDVVKTVLGAGGKLVGKTHTDELAYSLMGVNAHYGTPINSKAPDRVPGGSSSGSAAAVAANLADIGIGSDTGGSVRLPASFCGLWGIRTSHGLLSLEGAYPLAPSFDTVGWFTKDSELMGEVASCFGLTNTIEIKPKLIFPEDVWALADITIVDALKPAITSLEEQFGKIEYFQISKSKPLSELRQCFQICQAHEIWACHGKWVKLHNPGFGPGIKQRFEMASKISDGQVTKAQRHRERLSLGIRKTLGPNGVLVMPTSPAIAPKRDANTALLDDFRTRALEMLSIAGLAGLPQLSIPFGNINGAPIGMSLVGPRGSDADLIAMANTCFGEL